jgi:hypothetical protein
MDESMLAIVLLAAGVTNILDGLCASISPPSTHEANNELGEPCRRWDSVAAASESRGKMARTLRTYAWQ